VLSVTIADLQPFSPSRIHCVLAILNALTGY